MPKAPSNVSPLIPTLARRIVEMIRREGYPVGHRLTEQALCEELDVSRSPVRKALQFLQEAGAVTSERNRGFQVARMPAELGELELAPNPASAGSSSTAPASTGPDFTGNARSTSC
ncbi:GntR family transcriptional regulator [Variovorax sp. Sphag1AA]|uniref:GntR family transcriptional regulator n=1 Tax=Variovorax sp. Sphag1AA TaxID=2587027 RepID=UPI001814A60B|nr:GntR family transcriptional regulator [Variovorax sp. Sphag1AA]MBB3178679.1 DNA-binding GntR family transcriptional regulator [Variovorax sp. Sphag1AA]